MTATVAEGASALPVAGQFAAASVGSFALGREVLAPNTERIADKLGEILLALGVPRAWLMSTGKATDIPIAVPITDTKRDTDDYILLHRNTGINEVSSCIRKGFNFGFSSGSLGAKEFWYTADGLNAWLSNETFSKDYVITISVPKSIIGKLIQTQFLDGHLAAVVYPNNMNAFNKAKTTISVNKVKP